VLVLANFADTAQHVTGETLSGFKPEATALLGGRAISLADGLTLGAQEFVWLAVKAA
jgi:amylosucrase